MNDIEINDEQKYCYYKTAAFDPFQLMVRYYNDSGQFFFSKQKGHTFLTPSSSSLFWCDFILHVSTFLSMNIEFK